jgi:hypothetical protein
LNWAAVAPAVCIPMPVAAGVSSAMTIVTAGEVTAHVTTTHVTTTHMAAATATMAAAGIGNGRYQRQRQHHSPCKKDILYCLFHVDFQVNIIIYIAGTVETPVRS